MDLFVADMSPTLKIPLIETLSLSLSLSSETHMYGFTAVPLKSEIEYFLSRYGNNDINCNVFDVLIVTV